MSNRSFIGGVQPRQSTLRLGALRMSFAGVGCLGLILIWVALYAISVLWWGWLLMLAMGNWSPYHWSYLYTITHWALLAPFVLG